MKLQYIIIIFESETNELSKMINCFVFELMFTNFSLLFETGNCHTVAFQVHSHIGDIFSLNNSHFGHYVEHILTYELQQRTPQK